VSKFARSHFWSFVWYALVVLVVIGSLLPADSPVMKSVDSLPVGDKVQHFTAYAALAFLPTLRERPAKLGIQLAFAAVLGVLLEFGQLYSPGRSFDVYEMMADGLGILAGFVIGLPFRLALYSKTSEHP
jgi:VanZ family protein